MQMEFNPQNRDTHFLQTLKNISGNCKTIRIKKRLTVMDLSVKAVLDVKTIYNIESGVDNITLDTMFKICYALEIDLITLFGGEE